ncbi:chalcone isomerase family protein [Silvimonas sp. JCM 19000]
MQKRSLLKQSLAIAALGLSLTTAAHALEVEGQQVPEHAEVNGQSLLLDGAGLRKKVIFDVYVAALYTSAKTADGAAVINGTSARRMELKMLRGVGASTMHESFVEGLEANTTDAQLAAIKPRVSQLEKIFADVKKVEKGDLITLDFIPGTGTKVSVRGKAYPVIPGDDFASAMLSIWLGQKPVQNDLKAALLGKAS